MTTLLWRRSRARFGVVGAVITSALVLSLVGISPASADPGSNSISGTITDDGQPMPGATVDLFGSDENIPLQTVTADDGTYSFSVESPGTYRVRASYPHYDDAWWGQASSYALATPIDVSGTDVPGVDIQLSFAVYTLTGTVRGGQPAVPLEGVGVEVRGDGGGFTDLVETDSDGHYSITNLPERGTVHFIGTAGYANRWFDDVPDETHATMITFDSNKVADATLPLAGTISGTVRGLTDSGHKVAIAQSSVSLLTTTGDYLDSVYADDDGNFTFTGVAKGSYKLAFADRDSSDFWKPNFLGGVDRASLVKPVVLASGQGLLGVDGLLRPVPLLTGRVTDSSTGDPIGSTRVTLESLNGTELEDVYTDNGTYAFRDLQSGSYLIRLWGDYPLTGGWFGGGLSYASATPIVVKRGISVTHRDLTVVTGGEILGTLSGGGQSVFGTRPAVFTPKGQPVYNGYEEQGSFDFTDLKPGDYLLKLTPNDGLLAGKWWKNASQRATATRIHVKAGAKVDLGDIALAPVAPGSIVGHLNGGGDATVYVSGTGIDPGVGRTVQADADGDYSIAGLSPGSFELGFGGGGQGYPGKLPVTSGHVTHAATRTLLPTGQVTTSSTSDGTSYTGAIVDFFSLDGTYRGETSTDDGGGTPLELPVGKYKARFSTPNTPDNGLGSVWLGGRTSFGSSSTVTVAAGEIAQISADLPQESTFDGTVVVATSKHPLDNVQVRYYRKQPDGSYSYDGNGTATDSSGHFAVHGLGTGTYKFQLLDNEYDDYRTTWYGGTSQSSAKEVHIIAAATAYHGSTVGLLLPTGTVGISAPTFSGRMSAGQTLTARTSFVWPSSGVHLTYRWYRNGVTISGAIGRTYKLVKADMGREISVRITGSRSGYITAGTTSLPRNSLD